MSSQHAATREEPACSKYLTSWHLFLQLKNRITVPWTARRSNQPFLKEISPEYSLEGLRLMRSSNTLVTWCQELTHLKRPWCWERLKAGGEGDDRGWDGWIASPIQWTCIWASSRSWWWTGKPGVLQSMVLQRVGHDWTTEQNWTDIFLFLKYHLNISLWGWQRYERNCSCKW